MSTESIPVIDIGSYLDGSDPQGVAKQVGDACQNIGFFLISNHGISLPTMQKIYDILQNFSSWPLEQKMKTVAPFGLGYMGQGTENVAATMEEGSEIKDTKESLNLTLPVRDEVWPEDSKLRDLCAAYYESVEKLASQLMRLFALALNLDEKFFDDKVDHPYTTLRLLNYPPLGPNEPVPRTVNAEHTDYGTLTILWSPDSRGLQAQSRNGTWIDVISPLDHFIINIGDLMMNWTNDKWISTVHRVLPQPEGKKRMSMPFFHNPNPDAIIECIPSCHDDANSQI